MTASINRRQFLVGGLTGLGMVAAVKAGAVSLAHDLPDAGKQIDYDIVWHSKPIGRHSINIEHGEPQVQIEHEVESVVSVLFVTALTMQHKSSERWENGKLVELSADTVKNDQQTKLNGKQAGDQFVHVQPEKKLVLPSDIATVDSFWLMSAVSHNTMLDTRSGVVLDLKKKGLGK